MTDRQLSRDRYVVIPIDELEKKRKDGQLNPKSKFDLPLGFVHARNLHGYWLCLQEADAEWDIL